MIDLDLDPETGLARKMEMLILTGLKNDQGKTAKGDAAFSDGIEHVVFRYDYELDHSELIEGFEIPRSAQKMLR